MLGRHKYAGAVGLLLTLACGPKVEIGHGNGDEPGGSGGQAGSSTGGSTSTGAVTGEGGLPDDVGGMSNQGASAGSVGKDPPTGPIPPDNGPQAVVGKVDLLLAVDNSLSMAEKQNLFAKAVPELVKHLVNPRCVNTAGQVVAEPATPDAACPSGKREYDAVRDLHVGVITSSLGSHGAPGAKDVCNQEDDNDHAHLIPTVRQGVPSYGGKGYLNWDPDGKSNPPGENDVQAFADSLSTMITAANEHGCGFEAQLESVYRFLVDPEPPLTVELLGNTTKRQGVDKELLKQRASFLRPDSSVVVLMLTDENDCSIVDEGYGWLISRAASMYRSTSACATDPTSPCCQSCVEAAPNPGCPALNTDSECQKGNVLPMADDDLNLRCWRQKQRFGFDMLYPIERYIGGFSGATVLDRAGNLVENPLFAGGRDRSLFTLAVIGGLPWQDVAAKQAPGVLVNFTAEELVQKGRWPHLIGDPATYTEPLDVFMRESVAERTGNSVTNGEATLPSTSTDPGGNAVNGHEHASAGNDLQYACTFPLPEPVACDKQADLDGVGCDCFEEELPLNRSVCNPPAGGPATTTQHYGKAYPTIRELAVAKELGRRSVVGSICAVNTTDDTKADYGYRPVFNSIGQRVAATLLKP